jgi:hypothetical protein
LLKYKFLFLLAVLVSLSLIAGLSCFARQRKVSDNYMIKTKAELVALFPQAVDDLKQLVEQAKTRATKELVH